MPTINITERVSPPDTSIHERSVRAIRDEVNVTLRDLAKRHARVIAALGDEPTTKLAELVIEVLDTMEFPESGNAGARLE